MASVCGTDEITRGREMLRLEVDLELVGHAECVAGRGQRVQGEETPEKAEPEPPAAHARGGAVFRGGLKNGVFTTFARTRWRTASTVISNCTSVPSAWCGRSTEASAIIRFSTGDQVVDVALPTWRPLR